MLIIRVIPYNKCSPIQTAFYAIRGLILYNCLNKYFLFDTVRQYGIYSGYYIPIYNKDMANKVMKVIRYYLADDFVEYIKAVGKYKNGGYYTFSSKELEMWFNYCVEKKCF